MKKAPLYSASRRPVPAPPAAAVPADAAAAAPATKKRRWAALPPAAWAAIGLVAGMLLMLMTLLMRPQHRAITQDDIDAAVRASLEKEPLPSAAAKAYEMILPSVVRVVGLMDDKDDDADESPEKKAWARAW
jgi:serine protease DegQ